MFCYWERPEQFKKIGMSYRERLKQYRKKHMRCLQSNDTGNSPAILKVVTSKCKRNSITFALFAETLSGQNLSHGFKINQLELRKTNSYE